MNDTRAYRAPGCLSLLGGPLLAFGLWMIAQAFLLPHEAETVRLSLITGVFAAGVGGWLLANRLRRMFGRRGTTAERPSATAPLSAAPDGKPDRGEVSALETLGAGVGCLIIPLGFLLVGPIFLWLYFGGATTSRGNPVMGLVAGILFTSLGLLGVYILVKGQFQKRRNKRSQDPSRLP